MSCTILAPLVLLDEPTSALEKSEEEALFRLIRGIKEHGSVLFVSHRLGEVLSVCDIIHVLKDGRLVATVSPADVDERALHGSMVGRERNSVLSRRGAGTGCRSRRAGGVITYSHADYYKDVSFAIREGEVLGIGGLLNSGKSHLGKGIAVIITPETGTVRLGTNQPGRPDFHDLISKGLAYVPSERLAEEIILPFR